MVPSGLLTSSFVLEVEPVVDSSSLVMNLILNGTTPVQMVAWVVPVLVIEKNLPQKRLNTAAKVVVAPVVLLRARAIAEVVPPGICKKSVVQLVPVMALAAGVAGAVAVVPTLKLIKLFWAMLSAVSLLYS